MTSAICTLSEGHYHCGVGALVNSLHRHGFQGRIWVGYRGDLPRWASARGNPARGHEVKLREDFIVRFIKVETDWHFTNYKPRFMLDLWRERCPEATALFYFDPDIIVKCRWSFYEKWVAGGVALVHEIVSNNMPPSHPIRKEWEQVITNCKRQVTHELFSYINGGFCGVAKANINFLNLWSEIINYAVEHYQPDPAKFMSFDRTHSFYSIDQDALNVAAMSADSPLSLIGPEGMDFIPSGFTMAHAVGSPKPWRKSYFLSALKGIKPSPADKAFWANAEGPIPVFPKSVINRHQRQIRMASLIGRFYHQ